MAHEGLCYRNSKHNPASAEEYQAKEVARDLLVDEDGNYRGDDLAIFAAQTITDCDTRTSKKLIQEQAEIIGNAAIGKADHSPDIGHVIKEVNNMLYKVRSKDSSLTGGTCSVTRELKAFTLTFVGPFLIILMKLEIKYLNSNVYNKLGLSFVTTVAIIQNVLFRNTAPIFK